MGSLLLLLPLQIVHVNKAFSIIKVRVGVEIEEIYKVLKIGRKWG